MTRDINKAMMDYLPRYYSDSKIVNNLIAREAAEIQTATDEIADVLNQFFIDTATWGLAYWERICGIKTDLTKPYADRRAVIKSKLRGIGTVTVDLIKTVADSYTNGQVQVTEDNANYTVIVKFTSQYGIPPNLDDCKNALREIIPAHLAINYEFKYFTVADVQAMTIDVLQTQTLDKFAPFGA